MRVNLLSTSRADLGTITAVEKALKGSGVEAQVVNQEGFWVSAEPDLVVVAGDRFELLQAVVDIYIAGYPIAHLSGGDVTEGSQDDNMRHAITKLSHLHFVTNEASYQRVLQLGEEPWRVHLTGCPQIDNIELIPLQAAKHLAGIPSYDDYLLVVWHPDTLADQDENLKQVQILTRALDKVFIKTLVVGPNKDAGCEVVADWLRGWCRETMNMYVDTLPRRTYLTLMKHCRCLVGNSSSAFFEAPSFRKVAVNIGTRQQGRLRPKNIVDVGVTVTGIASSIELAVKLIIPGGNPYGDGNAAQRIASIIAGIEDPTKLLKKRFIDLSC